MATHGARAERRREELIHILARPERCRQVRVRAAFYLTKVATDAGVVWHRVECVLQPTSVTLAPVSNDASTAATRESPQDERIQSNKPTQGGARRAEHAHGQAGPHSCRRLSSHPSGMARYLLPMKHRFRPQWGRSWSRSTINASGA